MTSTAPPPPEDPMGGMPRPGDAAGSEPIRPIPMEPPPVAPPPVGPPPPLGQPMGGWDGGEKPTLSYTSFGLGIFSLLCCCCPFAGLPAGIAALITGYLGLKKAPSKRTFAIIGMVLGGIAVVLSVINLFANPDVDCSRFDGDLRERCEDVYDN